MGCRVPGFKLQSIAMSELILTDTKVEIKT
jgi:hypothetical protein